MEQNLALIVWCFDKYPATSIPLPFRKDGRCSFRSLKCLSKLKIDLLVSFKVRPRFT